MKIQVNYEELFTNCPSPSDDVASFTSAFRQAADYFEEQFDGNLTLAIHYATAPTNGDLEQRIIKEVLDTLYTDEGGLWLFDHAGIERAAVALLPHILP